MKQTIIYFIYKIYNLMVMAFFMGGSVYLIVEKSWSLWTILFGFILSGFFMSELKVRHV